jgi:hypothetical protein
MLGYNFRNDTIKKYIAIFGSLFNDLQIERLDSTTGLWNQIKIPLAYGPRDKLIAEAHKVFGDATQEVALISPRVGFEMVAIQYATQRKKNTYDEIKLSDTSYIYNTVPYDITFEVTILAKTNTDGCRIVEQILPFFVPSINITMFPFEGYPLIARDIKVVLQGSPRSQDNYEGDPDVRRSVMWTMDFVLQGYLYGPAHVANIIKKIDINYKVLNVHPDSKIESESLLPGLTANGQPTTVVTNSIPYANINPTDNWGYIEQF